MGKLSKDKRDIYYRLAKEKGYRARSAFKLLQIEEEFQLIKGSKRIVDLCAAPGSWCQVLNEIKDLNTDKNNENDRYPIIAVDLQTMAPIDNVIEIQGDITESNTVNKILEQFHGSKADLVLCDGAPDVFNLHDMDEYIQAQLVLSALNITLHLLNEGGSFIAKVFRGRNFPLLTKRLNMFFKSVQLSKPRACRNSSIEGFIICQGLSIPSWYQPTMEFSILDLYYDEKNPSVGFNVNKVQFKACGDRFGWDADKTYALNEDDPSSYKSLEPCQKPILPPYQTYLNMKRKNLI